MTSETSLPTSTFERLRRAVDVHGHATVRKRLGLAEATFWRCMAQAPVRRGTYHQIVAGLDALESIQ